MKKVTALAMAAVVAASALTGCGSSSTAETTAAATETKTEAKTEAAAADSTEAAKEEKVPPYIVFSDRTLVHMCLIKPKNKEEMLKVSGVGEYKFEKYGERFLDKIRDSLSGEL